MNRDIRAHPREFGHVHKPVLENRLRDHRRPFGYRHQGHELRLKIGREPGIGLGHRIHPGDRPIARRHPDAGRRRVHLDAGRPHRLRKTTDMRQIRAEEVDFAACNRRSHRVGTGLDPVRQYRMHGAMQSVHALYGNRVCANPVDLRAHRDQAMSQILNFGLTGGVDQPRLALRQTRRHHQVFGRADRHERKDDLCATQAIRRARRHVSAVKLDLCAQLLQALEMQVNRAGADRTSAGLGHPCLAAAGEYRTEHQHARPHFADQIVGRGGIRNLRRSQMCDPASRSLRIPVDVNCRAMMLKQAGQRRDIGQPRQVLERQSLVRQQRGGH
jgi:hypothetical protein